METQASSATAAKASPAMSAENAAIANDKAADQEIDGDGKPIVKVEKTPEERRLDQLQRGIDRQTGKYHRERGRREAAEARLNEILTSGKPAAHNAAEDDDGEPLMLTQKQFDEAVTAKAKALAKTLSEQDSDRASKAGVANALLKTWGKEKFDKLTSDIDDAFDGLTDEQGRFKPAIEAVFVSDHPARVIEYLCDPEHIEEAERIADMGAVRAAREIAKIDLKLAAEDAAAKPQASKVPDPLDGIKAKGANNKALASLSGDDFNKRRQEQIKNRR